MKTPGLLRRYRVVVASVRHGVNDVEVEDISVAGAALQGVENLPAEDYEADIVVILEEGSPREETFIYNLLTGRIRSP